jgi:hypothetical protein
MCRCITATHAVMPHCTTVLALTASRKPGMVPLKSACFERV